MIKLNSVFGELCGQVVLGLKAASIVLVVGFLLVTSSALASADTLQILLPDGKPAAGAKVQWQIFERDGNKSVLKVQSLEVDAEGHVDVEDVLGKARSSEGMMIIDHPDAALGVWNFFMGGKLQLAPSFKVSGKLIGVDGSPVSKGSARLLAIGTNTYSRIELSLFADFPGLSVTADKDGKFEFRGVTLNGYKFPSGASLLGEGQVNGQRYVGVASSAFVGDSKFRLNDDSKTLRKPDPPVELIVHPLGNVSGTVVNGHDQTPAGGVEIRVGGPGYNGESVIKSKLDGTFEIKDVPTYYRRSFDVGRYRLLEPKKGEREINVKGLRLPVYPMKVQASKLINSDSGKPPVIPLRLGYVQELEVGHGWKLHRAGSWGDIGMEAQTKPDSSFEMSLPTGPFAFTVESLRSNARGAYDWSGDLNLAADEELPAEFPVQRSKGILFKTVLPTDRKLNDPVWRTFIISVKTENGWTYARSTPLWFVPVKEWGDEVELKVEQRPEGQERRTLIDWTKFTAENKEWPVEIEFPDAVLGE